jgi:putative queuosine salvage protein
MSDDEADPELLALLRQHFQGKLTVDAEPETGVLESAEYVYDNSIDVAIDMRACKAAAASIFSQISKKEYSTKAWSKHELHPKEKDESTAAFIFTMDLLNFSFWSEKEDEDEQFAVEYAGKKWKGYWSLVASLKRALEEGRVRAGLGMCFIVWLTNDRNSNHELRLLAK